MVAYFRSLMIYHCTPLVACGLLTEKEVISMEREGVREAHLLPKDINRTVVMNVAQRGRSVAEVIRHLAQKLR